MQRHDRRRPGAPGKISEVFIRVCRGPLVRKGTEMRGMRGGQNPEARGREVRWIDDVLSIVDPFDSAQDRFCIEVEPGIHRD